MGEVMSEERPWRLQLICCGRDDGTIDCATRGEAEVARSAYTAGAGHDRQAILTGPSAHETDPAAILDEYLAALGKDLLTSSICGDMQALLKRVTADRSRLRAQLAEIGDEWSYETKNGWSGWQRCTTAMTEEYARERAASSDRNRLVHRKAGEWRQVEQESEPRLQCGCLGYCEGGPECLDDEGGPWPQEREASE